MTHPESRIPNPGSCYCDLWNTHPETLREQGIPQGYCGICSICGKPGHTRVHPQAPLTAAWCDDCYVGLVSARTPAQALRWLILLLALAGLWIGWRGFLG